VFGNTHWLNAASENIRNLKLKKNRIIFCKWNRRKPHRSTSLRNTLPLKWYIGTFANTKQTRMLTNSGIIRKLCQWNVYVFTTRLYWEKHLC